MKIYNIISIIYLELAIASATDPYRRQSIVSPPIIVDNEKEYKVERLLRKRQRRFERAKHVTI